jgi:hypothetical protein
MSKDTLKILLRQQQSALRKDIASIEDVRNWFVDNDYDDVSGFSQMLSTLEEAGFLLERAKEFIADYTDCIREQATETDHKQKMKDFSEWSEQASDDCVTAEEAAAASIDRAILTDSK